MKIEIYSQNRSKKSDHDNLGYLIDKSIYTQLTAGSKAKETDRSCRWTYSNFLKMGIALLASTSRHSSLSTRDTDSSMGCKPLPVPAMPRNFSNYNTDHGLAYLSQQRYGHSLQTDKQSYSSLNWILGRPARQLYSILQVEDLEREFALYDMVAPDLISNAQFLVPLQEDGWSCSFNSGARFAMMLNREIRDYLNFQFSGPLSVNLLSIRVGPNPGSLSRYISSQPIMGGCENEEIRSDKIEEILPKIDDALSTGRPVIILRASGQDSMHYETLVSRRKDGSAYIVMGTDGVLKTINTQELTHVMDASPYALTTLGVLSDFSAIIATGQCQPIFSFAPFFRFNYYLNRYPELSEILTARTNRGAALQLYEHFSKIGIKEGRTASPSSCAKSYLHRYTDLSHEFGEQGFHDAAVYFFYFGRHKSHDGQPSQDSCFNSNNYIVRPGDSMSRIAKSNKVSLSSLRNSNKDIVNYNLIKVGQSIRLPTFDFNHYMVQENDCLSQIAFVNHVRVSYLMNINKNIKNENLIIKGSEINVP